MSWLLNLYETYEANADQVGVIGRRHNDQEYTLLPISHTTQTAHIQVEITEDGQFHSAEVITDKGSANTLIPCTEDSASRSGPGAAKMPYPLHDKLSFVAGDLATFSGDEKFRESFGCYIDQLHSWAESADAVPKVKSIYQYLSKGRLVEDLIEHRVLFVDRDRRLIDKWDKSHEELYGAKPGIYSVVAGGMESVFVRFNIRSRLPAVWQDKEMYDSFIRFYSNRLGDRDICYVTGKMLPSTQKHANKIRNSADKAKLISANDSSGFTFRGRFSEGREAASISYEVSQKAHNALKWLINRQGKIIDGRAFLIWSNQQLDIPDPMEDFFATLYSSSREEAVERVPATNKEYADEVTKALTGYRGQLSTEADVSILILDSATTGRMAVLYYRNLNKELYLDRLERWYSSCAWLHRYYKNNEGSYIAFYGTPSPKDIAFAAYGQRASDKVVKGLMERMYPIIIDGRKIPSDIVTSAFNRASSPVSMDRWEWEKTLSIACALVNKDLIDKVEQKEGFHVSLDKDCVDRNYLFGRLLAVADVLERRALGSEEQRATNAIRYMNEFAKHPERTWRTIQAGLQPYQARLGVKATYWTRIIDEIASRFSIDQFNNKPLSGLYLLGFYSQRHELYQKKESNTDIEMESTN